MKLDSGFGAAKSWNGSVEKQLQSKHFKYKRTIFVHISIRGGGDYGSQPIREEYFVPRGIIKTII